MTAPPPAAVRGNDWRSLAVAPSEFFKPEIPATVVVPYYQAPEALALTLAGLEGQTYPRELFEVVVVDDGSDPPLELAPPTPLRVRVIHQEDLGFGLARARNNGARVASGDIIAFLDCDMVPEAEWLSSHARWHHAASDVVSLGFRRHVDFDGIGAGAVRGRPGSLGELLAGRPVQRPEWIERRMAQTDDLAADADDIFRGRHRWELRRRRGVLRRGGRVRRIVHPVGVRGHRIRLAGVRTRGGVGPGAQRPVLGTRVRARC